MTVSHEKLIALKNTCEHYDLDDFDGYLIKVRRDVLVDIVNELLRYRAEETLRRTHAWSLPAAPVSDADHEDNDVIIVDEKPDVLFGVPAADPVPQRPTEPQMELVHTYDGSFWRAKKPRVEPVVQKPLPEGLDPRIEAAQTILAYVATIAGVADMPDEPKPSALARDHEEVRHRWNRRWHRRLFDLHDVE